MPVNIVARHLLKEMVGVSLLVEVLLQTKLLERKYIFSGKLLEILRQLRLTPTFRIRDTTLKNTHDLLFSDCEVTTYSIDRRRGFCKLIQFLLQVSIR